jgi:hypothetical protein
MLAKIAHGVLWFAVVVGALYALFLMSDETPRRRPLRSA